jgi:hypothetical protein
VGPRAPPFWGHRARRAIFTLKLVVGGEGLEPPTSSV